MVVVPIASFFIRFGNFMNSEIIGRVTHVPWAIVFTSVDQNPRHPTQMYEAIYYLILFFLMYFFWSKKRNEFGKGFMFGFYLFLMFTFRFLIEFLKENQSPFENEMFINMGQVLSLPFVIWGMIMVKKSFKKNKATK